MASPLITGESTVLQPGNPLHDEAIKTGLITLLDRLTEDGSRVILLEDLPYGPQPDCLVEQGSECVGTRLDDESTAHTNQVMSEAVAESSDRVAMVSIADLACPDETCGAADAEGTLVRYDGVHFTSAFSRKIGPEIIERARDAGLSIPSALRESPGS